MLSTCAHRLNTCAEPALGEGELVDVPAAVVLVDGEGLLPSGEGDGGGDGGPGLQAAGGGVVDVAGEVGAGGAGDVQAVGGAAGRGQPQGDRVGAGRGHVDRVVEPLPGAGPSDVVAAAGVGAGLEVDAVGAVAVGGAVDRGDVVGRALPAGVVVGRLPRPGDRGCGPAVGRPGGAGEGELVDVPAAVVLVDGQGL